MTTTEAIKNNPRRARRIAMRARLAILSAQKVRALTHAAQKKKKAQPGEWGKAVNQPEISISVKQAYNFYQSRQWIAARQKAKKANVIRHGCLTCECCGLERGCGVPMNVDHIKPLRRYWDLRLMQSNLQVLCAICNKAKGNLDETDWRKDLMT